MHSPLNYGRVISSAWLNKTFIGNNFYYILQIFNDLFTFTLSVQKKFKLPTKCVVISFVLVSPSESFLAWYEIIKIQRCLLNCKSKKSWLAAKYSLTCFSGRPNYNVSFVFKLLCILVFVKYVLKIPSSLIVLVVEQ